ncbi:MAG: ATP-binding cassette domain-containing protein [Desulfovibrio sp.]|nr:ATP-binding cassette domain-containing protein [Desulfovibrio sp.]
MDRAVAPRAFLGIAGAIPTWMLESAGFATITLALYVRVRFWDADLPSIVWACSMLFLTAWRVLPSVGRAMRYLVLMRETRAAAIPVLQLLESFEEVAEEPEPDTAFRFEETLSLQGVSFRYAGSPEDSLKTLDLVLRKGEFLGVVGRSGAGKSTLAGVLCGLLAPTAGKMLVDGEELTPARLAAYRHMLGYVPQTPFLLDGTVAENVALSRWGNPVDREAVLRACRAAAMDFIVCDPGGLDRRVAEVCAGLSGGQVQRLSIARAIFTDPSLIIFDEATSALDHASEAAVKHTLEGLRGRVTCVLIAHGTTSLADCDRIAWLEDGRLRMLGTPAQVLPEYREHMAGPGKVEEAEKTAQ